MTTSVQCKELTGQVLQDVSEAKKERHGPTISIRELTLNTSCVSTHYLTLISSVLSSSTATHTPTASRTYLSLLHLRLLLLARFSLWLVASLEEDFPTDKEDLLICFLLLHKSRQSVFSSLAYLVPKHGPLLDLLRFICSELTVSKILCVVHMSLLFDLNIQHCFSAPLMENVSQRLISMQMWRGLCILLKHPFRYLSAGTA